MKLIYIDGRRLVNGINSYTKKIKVICKQPYSCLSITKDKMNKMVFFFVIGVSN